MTGAVVIGIGNAFRGDDGIGPAAAAALRDAVPGVRVLTLDGEPTRLVDAWTGHRLAVVVDAVRAGAEPGTLHRLEVGVDALPEAGHPPSSHAAGLATAVALGRALGRNPGRLVVHGVEPAGTAAGEQLSAPVAAALPELVDRVAREVRSACA